MVACKAMVCVVPCPSNFSEQDAHLARNDALILETPDEVYLHLVRRSEEADFGCGKLRKQLSQLPKLQ